MGPALGLFELFLRLVSVRLLGHEAHFLLHLLLLPSDSMGHVIELDLQLITLSVTFLLEQCSEEDSRSARLVPLLDSNDAFVYHFMIAFCEKLQIIDTPSFELFCFIKVQCDAFLLAIQEFQHALPLNDVTLELYEVDWSIRSLSFIERSIFCISLITGMQTLLVS